jgi:chromosome segregation ATPase
MNDSSPPMSKIFVQTLIRGLEEAKDSMNSMQKQIHRIDVSLTELKTQSKNTGAEVSQLVKIIRDGNGKASIIERVGNIENQIENKIKNLDIGQIQSKISELDKYINDSEAKKIEKIKGGWQVKVALITGSLGMIGGIATAVITLFFQ